MKNLRLPLIIVTILVLLVAIKLKFLTKESASGMVSGQAKDAPVLVEAFIVGPDTLNNDIFVSGSLVAGEQVDLMPEIAGRITKIGFSEGDKISQGSLLFKINDAEIQATLKKLKLQEKLASENLERRKKLLSVNGISQEDYDAAANQLATFQAEIIYTESLLAKTEIKAPFSGTIGIKNCSQGAFVTIGTALATLVQTNPLKVDFSVPEKYSSFVKTGQTIFFTVDGNPENFEATIKAFDSKIDENTRTIRVRALADNSKGKLIPGNFAEVQLPLKRITDAIMVPTQAIIPILKGQKVFLAKQGLAEESKVETGLRNDSKVQIIKGVAIGDTLVVSGLLSVKPGSKLKFTSSK